MPLPAESNQDIIYLVMAMIVKITAAAEAAADLTSLMTLLVVTFANNTKVALLCHKISLGVCLYEDHKLTLYRLPPPSAYMIDQFFLFSLTELL